MLLAHEVAHLARRDPLRRLLLASLRAVLFWHPLVHAAVRRLHALSEEICDAFACERGEDGVRLARCLLSYAQSAATAPPALVAVASRARVLEGRVRALLEPQPRRSLRVSRGALAGAVAGIGAVALAAPSLRVQDDAFVETTGIARTVDRKPWSGAAIRFVSYPLPDCPEAGDPHVVETTAGETGRFRCRLLAGRRYSAWATSSEASGAWSASDITEEHIAGRPLALEQARAARAPLHVQLGKLERWQRFGALRAELLLDAGMRLVEPVTLSARGELELPRVPGRHCLLLVRDGRGVVVLAKRLDLDSGAAGADGKDRSPLAFDLATPVELTLDVESEATEKPVAGARVAIGVSFIHGLSYSSTFVEHLAAIGFAHAGATGADGRLRTTAAQLEERRAGVEQLSLRVDAPGFATFSQPLIGDAAILDLTAVRVRLQPGTTLRGRVLRKPNEPAAGVPVVLRTRGSVTTAPNTRRTFSLPAVVARTTSDGSFAFAGVNPNESWTLHAPAAAIGVGRSTGFALIAEGERAPIGEALPGDIDATRLLRCAIEVVAADGSPAIGASAFYWPADRKGGRALSVQRTGVDARGNATLVLPASAFHVVATRDGAFAIARAEPGATPLRLTLQPMARFAGTVKDREGNALAGARLRALGWRGFETDALALGLAEINRELLRGTSDEAGRFALRFIANDRVMHQVYAIPATGTWSRGEGFPVGNESLEGVDLRVDR